MNDFDKDQAQALINAIARQREAAFNALAQVESALEITSQKLKDAENKIAELTAKLPTNESD